MVLIKISRFVYVILLILPITAQSEVINILETYNVVEGNPVTFICEIDGDISFTELSGTGYKVENRIINESKLNAKFIDRFHYSINAVTKAHEIVLKNISREQDGYNYICSNEYYIEGIILYVYYPPSNPPICKTNYYTKEPHESTILQCEVEMAKPKVYVEIFNISGEYPTKSYKINNTHIVKRSTLSSTADISTFKCNVFQFIPIDMRMRYPEQYSCSFNNAGAIVDRIRHTKATQINMIIVDVLIIIQFMAGRLLL